jgi:hypothetical protein
VADDRLPENLLAKNMVKGRIAARTAPEQCHFDRRPYYHVTAFDSAN